MSRLTAIFLAALLAGCSGERVARRRPGPASQPETTGMTRTEKTDAQWQAELTDEQFRILRQCGTEPPFTGKHWNEHRQGKYHCAACGQLLFDSQAKFDSGSGWPSYTSPAGQSAVATRQDRSHGMVRTEVTCSRCGGHLGHVFDDGPPPAGKRYCINSAALRFEPAAGSEAGK